MTKRLAGKKSAQRKAGLGMADAGPKALVMPQGFLVATPEQMRQIDARAIGGNRQRGLELMERAGQAVAEKAAEMLGSAPIGRRQRVCILCGPGNNGGDGLVAARLLSEKGRTPEIFLLGRQGELKGDARTNLGRLKKAGLKVREIVSRAGLEELRASLGQAGLAVDALFGTGFHGPAQKLSAEAIETLNRSGTLALAVDIPSGVDGLTGKAEGPAVRAAATVTMGLLKTGLLFTPGRELSGQVTTADIGLPPEAVTAQGIGICLCHPAGLKEWLPGRRPDAHKGDCGKVLVLAGSAGMAGAACLAAEAALRSGAGLVYLGVPESLVDLVQVKLTEAVVLPLAETRSRSLALMSLERILKAAQRCQAVALGPGLSNHPETAELACEIVRQVAGPLVLDADGINALAGHPESLRSAPGELVLTPHHAELSSLSGVPAGQIRSDPLGQAREATGRFGHPVVLKGAPTVTAVPDGRVWINPSGNAGMATAGSGDVLTGLVAGLLAQGMAPERAAVLGVYLHGLAGDLAAEEMTQYCLLAGDILRHLPGAFKTLMEGI